MGIIDLQSLKNYLDVSLPDAKLQVIVDSVNASLLRQMHRPSLKVSGVQYVHSSRLSNRLHVGWPIISVESLNEDYSGFYGQYEDAFDDQTLLVAGEDFVYDADDPRSPLTRLGGSWSTAPGSIKIDYTWGWSSPPNDLFEKALKLASLAYGSRFRIGELQSETFGKYSYQLLGGGASSGSPAYDAELLAIRPVVNAYALEVL